MPVNRNALIRYKTIDKCLQNRYRKWTLDDLIDACSDALYEYEGIDKGISKRTVQADIQMMRSDKLGYNAPIIVVDRKYYAYEDSDYSITNIPVTDQDLDKLYEAVEFLKQFKGFSHFKELDGMVQKLEDHVYSQKESQKPVIDFEKNENLKGLEFLDRLYQAIISRKAIKMTYQSFKARSANSFDFHPYLLKEFRNRWFVIGAKNRNANLLNLALDRIIKIEESDKKYISRYDFDAKLYFKDAIGVTVDPNQQAEQVVLFVTHKHAPYVLTKPLHWSQKTIDKDNYGVTISLSVQHNFELEKEILSLGDGIKVIAPNRLKRNVEERLNAAIDLYNTELSESGLYSAANRLQYKGLSVLSFVYTKREISKTISLIDKYMLKQEKEGDELDKLFSRIPEVEHVLMNKNIDRVIKSVSGTACVKDVSYFELSQKNVEENWHQDTSTSLNKKHYQKGYSNWQKNGSGNIAVPPITVLENTFLLYIYLDENGGAMDAFPGSHKKVLSESELVTISEYSIPNSYEIGKGGILLMKPLLLHLHKQPKSQKKTKVVKFVCEVQV